MAITPDEASKIAQLAQLHFSEKELDSFTESFRRILEYIEKLKEVDVQGVEPTSHVSFTKEFDKNITRKDEVRTSLSVKEALSGAPDPDAGHFRVPKVIS